MGRRTNKDAANFSFSDAGSGTILDGDSGATDSNAGGTAIIDPASLGTSAGNGDGDDARTQPKRGRGRPKGSGKKKASPDLDFFADMLLGGHAFVAFATGLEEIALDEDEAIKLSSASTELAAQYGVEINPKTQAWLRFAGAVSKVYGTRAMAIFAREKEDKKEEPKTAPNLAIVQ